jgi:DNA (cytosine-5)-methyltransferase 1
LVIEALLYAPPDDEYDEDENFQVIGETDPADLSSSDDSEGVPVRILTDFAIYESKTRQLVPIGELINVNLAVNSKNYRASGYVKPYIDDDQYYGGDVDDEDDEDVMSNSDACLQRIRSTRVRKFTLHDIRQRSGLLDE